MTKKKCDICGAEIGFLSQRKLKDGMACFDCMSKLGKEFSSYPDSFTVDQVRDVLDGKIKLLPSVKCQCTNGVLVIDPTNRVLYINLPLFQKTEEIK